MKIQIRRGVFETNSSSIHSLQLTKQTLDEAKKDISQKIAEKYFSERENVVFDESDYLYDNVLMLKGFRIEDGNEGACIYYVISNWVAKIQYLTMFLNHYIWTVDEYSSLKTLYNKNTDIMLNLKVYKRFVELIKEYAKTKGYNIESVVLDELEDDLWVDYFEFNDKEMTEFKITVELFEDLFNTLMDDNYVLTYCDEAYSPYITPSIYIY